MCILLLGGKQGEEEDDDDGSNGGVKLSEVKWSGDWLEDALIYEDWLNGYRMTMYVCIYVENGEQKHIISEKLCFDYRESLITCHFGCGIGSRWCEVAGRRLIGLVGIFFTVDIDL